MDDRIYLHISLIGPIQVGSRNLQNTTNLTDALVSSGILECRITGEVCNNYTIGSGIEVNPERKKFDFTTRLI